MEVHVLLVRPKCTAEHSFNFLTAIEGAFIAIKIQKKKPNTFQRPLPKAAFLKSTDYIHTNKS